MKRIADAGPEWGPFGYVEMEDGRQVRIIADEKTASPMKAKDGTDIMLDTVRTLSLHNGGVLYGCSDCEYVNERSTSITPHRNAHRVVTDKVTKATPDDDRTTELLDAVRIALRQAAAYEQLAVELAETRAELRRERDKTKAIRKAFGKLTED